MDALNYNVSASVSYGLGSGKGNLDYAKEIEASENSVYLLAKECFLRNRLANGQVSEKIRFGQMSTAGDAGRKQFFNGCGDVYAPGVRKGSEFFAIYQIEAP